MEKPEKKHTKKGPAPPPPLSQNPHKGVGDPGAHPSQKAHRGGGALYIKSGGLDDQQASRKRAQHRSNLFKRQALLQNQHAEQNGKKRRHLVQHGSVRQHQVVHRVKVAHHAHQTEHGTADEQQQIGLFPGKCHMLAAHHKPGRKKRDQVAEKHLLQGRQVPGGPDKYVHKGKTKRGQHDARDALMPVPDHFLPQIFLFQCLFHTKTSFTRPHGRPKDPPRGSR